MGRVQKEAFWLYGVIVGLAVREALSESVPHLSLKSQLPSWTAHLEAWRLVVFLALIVRFYLGAAVFFDTAYENESTAPQIAEKNYSIDYIMGFINFLMFFGLSMMITNHDRVVLGTSRFMWFLSAIILYDVAWLIVSWRYDTTQFIKLWTFYNAATFFVCGFVFLLVRGISDNAVLAEEMSFPLLLLISGIDIIEITRGKKYLMTLARKILP